jgi:hypothetical protein
VTFTADETSKTISVAVTGDTKVEPNATFVVNMRGAVGVTLAGAQGVGTMQNDDTTVLSINDVSRTAGNSGTMSRAPCPEYGSLTSSRAYPTLPAPALLR